MKKKLVPILVVLALVIVGVGSYFLGQRSNESTIENPPAQSSTPEATPDATTPEATPSEPDSVMTSEPITEELSVEELNPYFAMVYELIWDDPMYYHTPYGDYPMETDALQSVIGQAGHIYLNTYGEQYFEWKSKMFTENIYLLKFSGNRRNIVFAEVMPVYGTPHDTLEPVGEYYRFDVIEPAEISEDGRWFRAKDENGNYFYYKYEDLTGGLSDAEIDALYKEFQSQTQTTTQQTQPQQTQPQQTTPKQEQNTEQPESGKSQSTQQPSSSGDTIPDYLLNSAATVEPNEPPKTGTTEGSSTIDSDWTPGDDVAGITGP